MCGWMVCGCGWMGVFAAKHVKYCCVFRHCGVCVGVCVYVCLCIWVCIGVGVCSCMVCMCITSYILMGYLMVFVGILHSLLLFFHANSSRRLSTYM